VDVLLLVTSYKPNSRKQQKAAVLSSDFRIPGFSTISQTKKRQKAAESGSFFWKPYRVRVSLMKLN